MAQKASYRVGISGSYGGLNLGDEAILQSIMDQLRAFAPVDFTIFSRDPGDTSHRHQVYDAVPVRDLTQSEVAGKLEGLNLFILGGGGILFDSEARIYLREVTLAHEMGIPVMVYAVSAGPLKDRNAQKLVADALNKAAVITVRDRNSKRVLEECGVKREILVTADPALLLQPEPLPEEILLREGIDHQRRLIGMSVREPGVAAPDISSENYHTILANAADYMIDRYDADVLFIPMEHRVLDLQHSHAVVSQMLRPQRAKVSPIEYTPGQLLSLMEHFDFAVGMRLHFLIFAALRNIPFVALPYSPKVNGFLEDLDIKMPPINLVNAGRLIAHIDYFWDNMEEVRAKVSGSLPELQRRARQNNEIAVGLLQASAAKPGQARAA